MRFDFDWNFITNGVPYITISETTLALNKPAVSILGNPEDVIVGFDDKTMTIGIKKYNENKNVKLYRLRNRIQNGWVRIGCKNFIKCLSSLTELQFNPAIRYIAKFDSKEKILYISVLDAFQNKGNKSQQSTSKKELYC